MLDNTDTALTRDGHQHLGHGGGKGLGWVMASPMPPAPRSPSPRMRSPSVTTTTLQPEAEQPVQQIDAGRA